MKPTPNEYIADAAHEYARSRADLMSDAAWWRAKGEPAFAGLLALQAQRCEQAILTLAESLPGGVR